MPRISRATTAAPAPAPARAKGGSPSSKRKAAAAPAAASPSKRATLSNRRPPAPAPAPARLSGAARCVNELAPHGAEFNSSGLGSHFLGSSAPRKRAEVCYDIDPHRSRRAPRGQGRAAPVKAPARSKQTTVPKRTTVGSGLSKADRRAIPTRPAAARPAVAAPPPAGAPRVGQRVEVYWHGSKTWHAGVVKAAAGQLHFLVQYDTQGECSENFASVQWKHAAMEAVGAAPARKSPAAKTKRPQPSPQRSPQRSAGKKGAAAAKKAAAAAEEEEEEEEDVVEEILGERMRGGRREFRVQWRDGRASWEEYSEDYIRKHSAYDAYIAGVRKAARQGKTPPQRKKPAPEVTVAAVEEDDDDDDEQAGERGRKKVPWTAAEVRALRDGIASHGTGKWAKILLECDDIFGHQRTSVNLKDKWRNLSKEA